MAEKTFSFRSPGFFETETDLTQRQRQPSGVPAGIIGTANKGPAFVPITVGSFADFKTKFGSLDSDKFGPYAVNEFLKNRNAVTYIRVLGAGANETITDIENTRTKGIVKNAGFSVVASNASSNGAPASETRHAGAVQFIVAKHFLSASEGLASPLFTDNDSFNTTGLHSAADTVNLVRAMVLMASGTRLMVLNGNEATPASIEGSDDLATIAPSGDALGKFKLVISSSAGSGFATTDGKVGLKILTASLDPSNQDYIGNILNTDPSKFSAEQHLLYADFAVEEEIATTAYDASSVAVLSGSGLTSTTSGDTSVTFRQLFGRFDTRYRAPKTPKIISQPFGKKEFDLFHFEAISDGEYANNKYKISISNLRASIDDKNPYGTFTVLVRNYSDTDFDQEVLEQFPQCSLDPDSDNYIARKVGDKKVFYDFDASSDEERRLIIQGKYPNKSNFVRVVMTEEVETKIVPAKSLPFGFRGIEVLKTSDTMTDNGTGLPNFGISGPTINRLAGQGVDTLTGSVVPPLPFRFKITRGEIKSSVDDGAQFAGTPGVNEIVDGRLFWGVKTERVPLTGTVSNATLNPNASSEKNKLIEAYSKFLGLDKLDALVTGSGADAFNNNKFTLSRVAFGNTTSQYTDTELTGSAAEHIKEAVYIRNASPDPNEYKVSDGVASNRITLGTLIAQTSSVTFNKFTEFAKFTTILAGGFDGVNILDKDAIKFNDKASSQDTGGGASSGYASPGLGNSSAGTVNIGGTGKSNNAVFSYRSAIDILTDPMSSNIDLLAIPGIRDSFVTDRAGTKSREFGLAMYVMDPVEYDHNTVRLFDDSVGRPDVTKTAEQLDTRAIDNDYVSAYFPNVVIKDEENNRLVEVPPSVAALGALSFNDRISFPWFAPAGFNRGSLDFVRNTGTKLNSEDRDKLYDSKINPIANLPGAGNVPVFVIFGQKTLKQARSALDRVNVRRLLLEVKRIVIGISRKLVFEQNNSGTRARFISQVVPRLAVIQAQSGIEAFKIVMDESNNTQRDVEENRLNGRIFIRPTRTIEFIAVDFIITNDGVTFT